MLPIYTVSVGLYSPFFWLLVITYNDWCFHMLPGSAIMVRWVFELVWGTGADHDRGEDAIHSDSFPVTCNVEGRVDALKDFSEVTNLQVDTNSWFE
jgi:hypothetical protein